MSHVVETVRRLTFGGIVALLCPVGSLHAQAIERPAREVGVTPFGAVLDFGPDGGWRSRAREVAAHRAQLRSSGRFAELNLAAATGQPTAAALTGTFRIPAIPFRFADHGTAAAIDTSAYRAMLFGQTAPAGRPYSLRSYYAELSNGLLDYTGDVTGWVTLDSAEAAYTGAPGSCTSNPYGTNQPNGIWCSDAYARLRGGLVEALQKVDASVDFSLYDGDGNGVVDFVLFLHSELDGSCLSASNNHMWAHRSGGLGYVTNDPAPGGGSIVVSDYILQSAVGGPSCDSTAIMGIGTVAHESGHAFGLPDLYDTSQLTAGIGRWGLMGSGNWSTQYSPARMEAWSLDRLGWVTVVPLTAGGTYSFGPAPTSDTTFMVRVMTTNPRGEYFLLENRQGVSADSAMVRRACEVSGRTFPTNCAGGLALWHVDSAKVVAGGGKNAGTIHAVALVEADGLRQLWADANAGDAGDLYPGTTGNTAFGPATNPAAVKNADGEYVGFTIDSIQQLAPGGAMGFRLSFGIPLVFSTAGPGTISSIPSVPADTALPLGTVVTLVAAPDAGAVFEGWAGDTVTTNDTLVLSMTRAWTVSAVFVPQLLAVEPSPAGAVMGASFSLPLAASGGTGGYTWSLAGGVLPAGVTLKGLGAISGIPEETGSFSVSVQVTSGTQTAEVPVSVTVTAPVLTTAGVLGALVGTGATLTADEVRYLDLLGNRNGRYDVGDFHAFIAKTGGAASAEMMAEMLRTGGAR